MKITTLWHASERPGYEMPWLIDAYDEYTWDTNGGQPPDGYTANWEKNPGARELCITIPEDEVERLFTAPIVEGQTSG